MAMQLVLKQGVIRVRKKPKLHVFPDGCRICAYGYCLELCMQKLTFDEKEIGAIDEHASSRDTATG